MKGVLKLGIRLGELGYGSLLVWDHPFQYHLGGIYNEDFTYYFAPVSHIMVPVLMGSERKEAGIHVNYM